MLFAALLMSVQAGIASAHSSNAPLSITASVSADCVIESPSALNFGIFDPATAREDADVTADAVSISCTRGASGVTIALDAGTHAAGRRRAMAGDKAGPSLFYEVYTSAAHTVVWNEINTVAYVPAHAGAQRISLYGRIPAGQTVRPGRYADTLLAMVNF